MRLETSFLEKNLLLLQDFSITLVESRGPFQLPLTNLLDVDGIRSLRTEEKLSSGNQECMVERTSASRNVLKPAYRLARG